MIFGHNGNLITQETYEYTRNYRKELLKSCTRLLHNLDIKYVISHGNLIEYSRQKPICHDDDVDLRINLNDIHKLEKINTMNINIDDKGFCRLYDYNLILDDRCMNLERFKFNGLQGWLMKNYTEANSWIQMRSEDNFIAPLPYKMDIHIDLVPNITTDTKYVKRYNRCTKCYELEKTIWPDYDIDFTNLRKIKYMGIDTYAPSLDDTKRKLEKQYGPDYMIPNYDYELSFSIRNDI